MQTKFLSLPRTINIAVISNPFNNHLLISKFITATKIIKISITPKRSNACPLNTRCSDCSKVLLSFSTGEKHPITTLSITPIPQNHCTENIVLFKWKYVNMTMRLPWKHIIPSRKMGLCLPIGRINICLRFCQSPKLPWYGRNIILPQCHSYWIAMKHSLKKYALHFLNCRKL